MSVSEPNPSQSSEIAHVLFLDIVAYSTLPASQQQLLLEQLNRAVRHTSEFARALAEDQLISLPTGDGMALVFFRNPEAPVRCALQLSQALPQALATRLRMGIHTGPVYRVADINANLNVTGGGINVAQRVMDCGDPGHILVSKATADVLCEVGGWKDWLQDLGELKVKHGVRLHLFEVLKKEDPNRRERTRKLRRIRARLMRRALTLTFLLIAVGAVVAAWLIYSRNVHALTNKDTIVLADFDNKTGDPVFDDTLRQGLSMQLEQSPFLSMISDSRINHILNLMGRPAGDRLTPEVTREVCQRSGSKAMLTGSIAPLGNQFVIGLQAVNCQSGDLLAEAQEQASGKEGVLKALDAAAVRLRSKLGESLSTVQEYATPLADATTSSLEALKAYSLGVRTAYSNGDTQALPLYKRAVELDPKFALAYSSLAVSYRNLNEGKRAGEFARKAYELRDQISERERLGIEANYYQTVTGELEKAAQVYELWQQTYPRNSSTYTNLMYIAITLGNYEKAIEESPEALRLDPNGGIAYLNLAAAYVALNRFDEAEAVYKQAEERRLEGEILLADRYALAFLRGDSSRMAQLVSSGMGKPGIEDLMLSAQADTEAWSGKFKTARELTRRAMDSAERNDAKETSALYQSESALREVEAGYAENARKDAHDAIKLAANRDVTAMTSLAFARTGDIAGAERLASELDGEFPLSTVVQRYWLPSIRAAIAMNRGQPNAAVELLNESSAIELGSTNNFVILVPVFLRGQAYLALHDGNRAAAEFQKFIDHAGMVGNFPWGALARLGLARSFALQAQTAQGGEASAAQTKARAAYQDFLTLWKDADSDNSILKRAKAEYANLQ